MTAPTENPAGTWSIWKPVDQEFKLAVEFQEIATALGTSVGAVIFDLVQVEANGEDGHTLPGHL